MHDLKTDEPVSDVVVTVYPDAGATKLFNENCDMSVFSDL